MKALVWANQYQVCAYYDHNQISYLYEGFVNILAVTNNPTNIISSESAFTSLHLVLQQCSGNLVCGLLSYDLKNQIENLKSEHFDFIGFPLMYFFEPEVYIYFHAAGGEVFSRVDNCNDLLNQILDADLPAPILPAPVTIQPRVSRDQYLQNVLAIQNHILEGDVYELNYCIEFFADNVSLHTVTAFQALNEASPMPFAGYFKYEEIFLLCASPERFLKKSGHKLISQPIKGTGKRSLDAEEDRRLRAELQNSEKEQSENMMIMDLVRNDLSKSSVIGSVQVEEMFGIYGFRHLYQMITTVTGEMRPDCSSAEALKNAFPMGSMTGAPKIKAMQLIERYENSRRGLFSGSIGYFLPNGDFDFNVVIRSLQYNAATKKLSFWVGSAITFDAVPEQEYEECLLKAKAIMKIL